MPACNGCGAAIAFVVTPAGKKLPVDATYGTFVAGGALRVVLDDGSVVAAHLQCDPDEETFRGRLPHWASCRRADSFRAKGRTAP